jgi:hypothetical protein
VGARGRPTADGRWEAVEADSLDELATLLNGLGVKPDHLVHLIEIERPGDDTEGEAGVSLAGWLALVWVG